MNIVFVDTGYLFALEIANDQHHRAATLHWQSIAGALPRLVTTSYVFDEDVTFFNSRGQHAKAIQVGNELLNSPSVQFIHVDTALFYAAWASFQRH
ncbi:MAG: type II toxin-antitoxin system VapC family toxin [Methylococcales bacterium]